MKHRMFPIVMSLGLVGITSLALADSVALQRAQQAASELDISKFLTSRTDARSQSFGFGGTHEHRLSVEKAGRYIITSTTMPGNSDDYRIEASLLDGEGNIVATEKGLGQSGGLRLVEALDPGDYELHVTAYKFGSEKTGGDSYNIEVAGLGDSGERLASDDSGINAGSGIKFSEPGRDGRTTAFVDREDAVATIAAPQATNVPAPSNASASNTSASAAQKAPAPTEETSMPQAFDEIVADIKIRERGEVLTFDVAKAGTVAITSSTFPGNESRYRLEARVLDESGAVVASDEGEGFEGDFAIRTRLQPGRYTVWVNGQKFGAARSGVNNYTLRVQQLDAE